MDHITSCCVKFTFAKYQWILSTHSNATCKNVSWPHFSWPTLYVAGQCQLTLYYLLDRRLEYRQSIRVNLSGLSPKVESRKDGVGRDTTVAGLRDSCGISNHLSRYWCLSVTDWWTATYHIGVYRGQPASSCSTHRFVFGRLFPVRHYDAWFNGRDVPVRNTSSCVGPSRLSHNDIGVCTTYSSMDSSATIAQR